MPYPVILGGDHAEFEQEWAASGRPDHERPDWPLPSFDARDWASAFRQTAIKLGYSDMDEGWLITWFANALMRGYDQHAAGEFGNARSMTHIVTLEEELQELVERMLDDTDLASYADVVSRAIEAIKRERALRCSCQIANVVSDECARLGKCKERVMRSPI